MPASELTTIDDVLAELDDIVTVTMSENSPLVIFAFVYHRTTARIAEGIREGTFEDPQRMERFDVDFAKRYIEAFWRHRHGKPVPFAWEIAFRAAGNIEGQQPTIMQHILLGMNAHINLDLGVTAAEVVPAGQIQALKNDFMIVNTKLEELIDEMQERIGRVSPLMFLLDLIGERNDEAVINFSIRRARDFAWTVAQTLAHAEEGEKEHIIREVDEQITGLAKSVLAPPGVLLPNVLSVIRRFEVKDNREIIERVRA